MNVGGQGREKHWLDMVGSEEASETQTKSAGKGCRTEQLKTGLLDFSVLKTEASIILCAVCGLSRHRKDLVYTAV